ncbi:hypothetical protein H9X96_08770 [Pedobacter sp. N36a]|uniref:hypothetical protein n=1 Tax=Pedobacter sp. N36a TaxID=2767996 RepID=UPI0016572E98|nr:hypothetical protein [Pedobacter sp. N36a]MBC8985869.1 hypothetical protein [Pedobacter sp. N36a]
MKYSFFLFRLLLLLSFAFLASCSPSGKADTAFYYWKQSFSLSQPQQEVIEKAAGHKLYLRFFDIKWNTKENRAYPEAVINLTQKISAKQVTPVIFITNQTFEKLTLPGVDSLAEHTQHLLSKLSTDQKLNYQHVQFDCDWSLSTKDKYFHFLKTFKTISNKSLEATIRLHQVKYQIKTGVPPVDRGVLMFYNMGKISAKPEDPNSIYNSKDAATYISHLPKYLLPLDIALPLFSWSIHIRNSEVIQVYGKIGKSILSDVNNFETTPNKHVFKARRSFFTEGVYVKIGDLFKLEETDKDLLDQAAEQLAKHLSKDEKRTIIYYEIGNFDPTIFRAKDLLDISARF